MELTMTSLEHERKIHPSHDIKLFAGRSNSKLAQEIADYLGTTSCMEYYLMQKKD